MAEQKHASGPWKVGGVDGNIWIERSNAADPCICDIVQSGFDKTEVFYTSEDEANARLIAAAPDLLAALKEALSELATEYPIASRLAGNWPEMVPVFERINAAIAKAEGR